MPEETAVAASDQQRPGSSYMGFAVKVVIVTTVVALGLVHVFVSIVEAVVNTVDTQQVRTKLRAALKDEKTRVRLKGLLTNNPAVHYRVATIEEAKGNFEAAIEEIELALGLLELHATDRATQAKYQSRLQELKRKQGPQPGSGAKR
jgi:hypothetical protein